MRFQRIIILATAASRSRRCSILSFAVALLMFGANALLVFDERAGQPAVRHIEWREITGEHFYATA